MIRLRAEVKRPRGNEERHGSAGSLRARAGGVRGGRSPVRFSSLGDHVGAPHLLSLIVATVVLWVAAPVAGHHVGSWTPRDNEVSANFKQLKFSIQAGKFAVARRLYAEGPLRKALRAQAANLPARLEETIDAALQTGDAAEAERGLMVFFAALVRGLALEADRQLGDASLMAEARVAAGRKFLDAIWRYYNLIDFAVSQRHPKVATAVRLAYDEAEGYAKAGTTPAADPGRLRGPLRQIADVLAGVIEAGSASARRSS